MNIFLDYTDKQIDSATCTISGSKSESNRLLILQRQFSELQLENVSDSDDTKHLIHALQTQDGVVDIGHAGTAMRFLTAYFSVQSGKEIILKGSDRMHNRPIKILVDALRSLGATIEYQQKEGYPPLRIRGKKLTKNKVQIDGNVSSQYISALLLIAPSLESGLTIELLGNITSRPYLEMTLALLKDIGIKATFEDNYIKVQPKNEVVAKTVVIESDWSSASYFYSLVALSELGTTITLTSYKKESLQGDSCLAEVYNDLGVVTLFSENSIILKKAHAHNKELLKLNLQSAPDIAQTIAVSCLGLGIGCELSGLHTLKIKETDRLVALENELSKLGASITITNDSLQLMPTAIINKNVEIATYDDHRMAMAFAPLALKVPITILDADVVTKSYTDFWKHFKSCFQER